jgi:cyclophilin family peptidyl-prolyl cis-trans isomerase/HEAT repeat protein
MNILRFSLFSCAILILLTDVEAFSQHFTPDERKVLELRDMRTFGGNDELSKYLLSTDPDVRARAIYALGNIGDSNTVTKLNYLLAGPFTDYPNENDMRAAAFAVGQIPCEESRKFIRLMLEDNSKFAESTKKYFIDASGRIGDSTDLVKVSAFAYSQDTGITRAAAMSVARFGLRKIKSQASVDALRYLTNNSSDKLTLSNTAFAFWRTGDKALLKNAEREIHALAESEDAQTRMWGFNALGRLADKKSLIYTLESYMSEKDWRVRVNMLNTLAAYNADSLIDMNKQINTLLWTAMEDENENVTLNAISVAGRLFSSLNSPESIAWKIEGANILKRPMSESPTNTANEQGAAAIALAQIRKDKAKDDLFRLFNSTQNYKVKADVLRALGNFDNATIYKEVRDTVTAEVMRYNEIHPNTDGRMIASDELAELYRGFVEMMSSLDNKLDAADQKTSRLIFLEFAGSKDPLITSVSFDALQDSIYFNDRKEIASVMKFDFNELKSPEDMLIQLIFIDAFKNLGIKDASETLEPLLLSANYDLAKASADAIEALTGEKKSISAQKKYDFDWNFIESCIGKKAILKTSQGDIKLELYTQIAPFTVQSFIKLAGNKFFNSTKFHRVVPNFVIQGGDPTSTGYGGPDYSIRSEFNDLTYDEGILGMASSGKDTEGSQFFITHSRTPHLDGRYTIFGKVTEGMQIVDKVMVGDFLYDILITE